MLSAVFGFKFVCFCFEKNSMNALSVSESFLIKQSALFSINLYLVLGALCPACQTVVTALIWRRKHIIFSAIHSECQKICTICKTFLLAICQQICVMKFLNSIQGRRKIGMMIAQLRLTWNGTMVSKIMLYSFLLTRIRIFRNLMMNAPTFVNNNIFRKLDNINHCVLYGCKTWVS